MSNTIVSMQVTDAVWVSMLMSALAGIVAVCLMIATFYCIRYSHAYCAADPAPLLFVVSQRHCLVIVLHGTSAPSAQTRASTSCYL